MARLVRKLQVLVSHWEAEWFDYMASKTGQPISKLFRIYAKTGMLWWTHYLENHCEECAKKGGVCLMSDMIGRMLGDKTKEDFRDFTYTADEVDFLAEELDFQLRTVLLNRFVKEIEKK